MVGVPSALHLAAALLAVAASVGLGFAIAEGVLTGRPVDTRHRQPMGTWRTIGVLGALVYAAGHVMAGALVGDPTLWTWLHVGGLAGLAVGAGPAGDHDRSLPLLIPVVPQTPSWFAAGAGLLVAVRMLGAGRAHLGAALGMVLLGLGHAAAPLEPVIGDWLTIAGAVSLGGWLWVAARHRILAKLLAAFGTALLALAILLAAVLSTVGAAQLTNDELTRLSRLAEALVQEVSQWPAEAVNSAAAIAIAPRSLLETRFAAQEAAELYRVGFADQDFFLVLDAAGQVVNQHPQDLGGSLVLSLTGDPLVGTVRAGTGDVQQAGGMLSTGGRVVAFGAVALRPDGLLPEDPPGGVLVTGRLVDVVWAEQESASLDVGIVGVVDDSPAFTAAAVGTTGDAVLDGLGTRDRADLGEQGLTLFAASASIVDPESGATLGRIITTSTPAVIAAVERAQTQRLFVVALAGGLLAIVAGAIVTRRFVRPISQLTEAARQIGAGDLGARAGVDSADEVGLLGRTFDEMVGSLSTQRAELTDAARTESKLRGRLESLTTSMSDGLIAADADGHIIQFNPAAEALTGLLAVEVIGEALATVMAERIAAESATEAVPGMSGEADLHLDDPLADSSSAARVLLVRPDGEQTPAAVTAAPVRSPDGELLGRVFVLRDISREIEVERMKTEFLANVSHELRTPITPIKGYANVLARRDVGAEATQRFAGEILNSTARLERIVGMIVDFAGLDSGRVVLEPEPIDLTAMVAETLEEWRAGHDGREFGNFLNGGLPPVLADPVYLRRVLDELLDNAVKFSPDGDPVDVTARAEGGHVRLSVIDRGIGIDPKAAAHLFTDFRQVDGTETRHYGGLGLGLGLVKRILDGSGATAEVDSDPGVGATVSLLLPVGGPVPVPALPMPPLRAGTVPPPPL